ncbi:hypothetical protein GCE86_18005 [Micromonospora terminaliae]|uniref:Uncharacterized protein n=1 Tax=Micromonospora terminaliae TaxID=1914461 RepID=A0AAJ2ZGI4_9ACTN|nr:hypothetical protein [Micromonospora terminaliae]NES29271.1 hypothetical protein [Micromonospora terminaliae]QGL48742.1 hypothetical protein GCE86_18005 [Micromonospora terminaliae]
MAGGSRRSRSWWYAVAVSAVLAVAVGAAVGAGRDTTPPPGDHGAAGRQPVATAPPPAAPAASAPAAEVLHAATQLLIRDCMQRRGFRYWPVPRRPVPELREFPYVLDDVSYARRHGYGGVLERRFEAAMAADPNTRYARELPPERAAAAVRAVNGDPGEPDALRATLPAGGVLRRSSHSCTSEAERHLYGDLPAWYRAAKTTDNLAGLRVGRVLADRRYAAGVTAWRRCMRGAGHDYADPAAARASVPEPASGTVPAGEVRLAVAEASCATETGLGRLARRLDAEHRRAVERQFPTEVADRLRLEGAALPRARAVLAGG